MIDRLCVADTHEVITLRDRTPQKSQTLTKVSRRVTDCYVFGRPLTLSARGFVQPPHALEQERFGARVDHLLRRAEGRLQHEVALF